MSQRIGILWSINDVRPENTQQWICFGRSYMMHSSQNLYEHISEGEGCIVEKQIAYSGVLWIWAPGVNSADKNSKEQS